jgi:hypothetical protein
MPSERKQVQIQVEIPADLTATYSNLAMISHTPSEIFIDLASILPNVAKTQVHTRLVMTPMNAKLLQNALTENLRRFEAQFGEIKTPATGINPHLPNTNGTVSE